MRTAVIDIGTNSTRLLIADVSPAGQISELSRRSIVTRLGAGVDSTGALAEAAQARVVDALEQFRPELERLQPERNLAVLTSAVREASNGAEFAKRIGKSFGLDARVLSGDEEARLTFLGAMSEQSSASTETQAQGQPTVVIDIGGGSTEFVVGVDRQAGFHVSLDAGVVRMSERHIHSDPPDPAQLQALAADTRSIFLQGLPAHEGEAVQRGIAVAGTATSAAAIDQALDPYDPVRVHGYTLLLATVELLLARLADMTEDQRRSVVGLDPSRAPTIVAGMILLSQAMRMFDLDRVEVSEHDILYGGALMLAGLA
ncbi:MAG TPA: Ppx/GppA phosphatase family protein [Solirubrobacteraceae bacterium]|nr:Ppx/GppA phosphatase family protein [Solirubrobacteraceae bacterium]